MAAVWIILSKARFPTELIESARERGVQAASVSFDVSAEFMLDLLRDQDKRLRQAGLWAMSECQVQVPSVGAQRQVRPDVAWGGGPPESPLCLASSSGAEYVHGIRYQPKVHIVQYECLLATYYRTGIFPVNEVELKKYEALCAEANKKF